jgi:hypothetical protein
MSAMNAKNPVLDLLGHFAAIGWYCDLCSIGMEDAVRIAQQLEGIRNKSPSASTTIDGWWREFSGYLAGLSALYSQLKESPREDYTPMTNAKQLVGDGTRTGQQLFDPFGGQLQSLDPRDISMITEVASDLLDAILVKFLMVTENR